MKLNSSFFLLLSFLNVKGQTAENLKHLQQKILSADSIVLISHVLTVEFAPKIVEDWDKTKKRPPVKKYAPYPKYLKYGKINPAIIKQRHAVSKVETKELSGILQSGQVDTINWSKCDLPHHSIAIYKNNIQSYIDICFGCKHINTSKDINLTEGDLSEKIWEDLKAFFNKHGLTYQLLNSDY